MPARKPVKPEPINKHIVCSVCGLDWSRHGKEPGLEKCIELLQQDLASANRSRYYIDTVGGGSVGQGTWTMNYPTSAGRPPTMGI